MRIYPIGYNTPGSEATIDNLMQDKRTLLIDVRYSPNSPKPQWQQSALRAKYKDGYIHEGRLGNINYRGGPIQLANPDAGIGRLKDLLDHDHNLILLCACENYLTCHRKVIVELLKKEIPEVEIVMPENQPSGTMKCLSIMQPWAWLIVQGKKDLENRDWTTNYRGPILIHTGKKVDDQCFEDGEIDEDMAEYYGMNGIMPALKSDYTTGAIIGRADLVDVVTDSSSKWFVGAYGFLLENASAFDRPIPYSGSRRLFDVPTRIIEEHRKWVQGSLF